MNSRQNRHQQTKYEKENQERMRSSSAQRCQTPPPIKFKQPNNKSIKSVLRTTLIPFHTDHQQDPYLLDTVVDKYISEIPGQGSVWKKCQLDKKLKGGQETWENWESLRTEFDNEKMENFDWLIEVEFTISDEQSETKKETIGIVMMRKYHKPEISKKKILCRSIYINESFKKFHLKDKIDTNYIWEAFQQMKVPYYEFYDFIKINDDTPSNQNEEICEYIKNVKIDTQDFKVYRYFFPQENVQYYDKSWEVWSNLNSIKSISSPKNIMPKWEEPESDEFQGDQPQSDEPQGDEPQSEEPQSEEPQSDERWNYVL